jgi:uncharacterized protein
MELSLDRGNGVHIRNYQPGKIETEQGSYTNSIIITGQHIEIWRPTCWAELTEGDVVQLIQCNPKIVLIGTGAHLQFTSPALFQRLIEKNIGYEIMDTAAACRTYNVLMTENRAVVAGLLVN